MDQDLSNMTRFVAGTNEKAPKNISIYQFFAKKYQIDCQLSKFLIVTLSRFSASDPRGGGGVLYGYINLTQVDSAYGLEIF